MRRKHQGKKRLKPTLRATLVVWLLIGVVVPFLMSGALALAETRTVTADESLAARGVHRWLLGSSYRELWTTPIEVEVLDLQRFAGGLRPAFRVGGLQTLGLAMSGADGRSYTFRSLVKDNSESLPADFKGTFAADIAQDLLSASHPAATLVVPPLATAAGVLHSAPRLVMMPDDPVLGEFRELFAGRLGTLEEFPTPRSDQHRGFQGATAIISTDELWPQLVAGPQERIDARALLRARLFDVFLGDWDRHAKQWRWARLPGQSRWLPLPEDRDWAFANFEGLLLTLSRPFQPTFVPFRDKYPTMTGLTLNGSDLIRWVLPELEKSVWEAVAADLQQRLTDAVIDEAIRQMPRPYQDLIGAEIKATLTQRRDRLPEVADRLYRFLAAEVDVQGTDQSERVDLRYLNNGDVEVSVALKASNGAGINPYFQRRFSPTATREIRIYLRQGADTITCHGRAVRKIKIRVIGSAAEDVTDGCEAATLRFTDAEQLERDLQPVRIEPDARSHFPQVPILPKPWAKWRDWGRNILPVVWIDYTSDHGLLVGGGVLVDRFGFGKVPYAQRHIFKGAYLVDLDDYELAYEGLYRYQNPALLTTLDLKSTNDEIIRFYGFGNDTSSDGSDSFFQTEQTQYIFAPGLRYLLTPQLDLFAEFELTYASTDDDANTLLNQQRPYGVGDFGQIAFSAGLEFDTRDRSKVYGPGVRFRLQGTYFPEVWDVESTFGSFEGEVSGYLALSKRLLLALRVNGKHVFGTFPFHEAAYIGGSDTLRGYRSDRFASDASFFANTELRFLIGKAKFIVPAEWNVFAFSDVGRVFGKGDDSNKWHPTGGGGFFAALVERSVLLKFSVAGSDERTEFNFKTEFTF